MNKVLLGVKLCFFAGNISRPTPAVGSFIHTAPPGRFPWSNPVYARGGAGAAPPTGHPSMLHRACQPGPASATLNSHDEGLRAASCCPLPIHFLTRAARSTEQGGLHHAGIIPTLFVCLLNVWQSLIPRFKGHS